MTDTSAVQATDDFMPRRAVSRRVAVRRWLAVLAAVVLMAAGCGAGATEAVEGTRANDAPDQTETPAGDADEGSPEPADSGDSGDDDAEDAGSSDAGGSPPRDEGSADDSDDSRGERASADDADDATATGSGNDSSSGDDGDGAGPNADPEDPADASDDADDDRGTEPVAAVTPTATPLVVTSQPDPVLIQPVPTTGPVPSDDLSITGPVADDALPATISDGGALACAATEEAIEFLDRGDLRRLDETLVKAGGHAAQAAEANISAQADALLGGADDVDAAFELISETLIACAVNGYEV